MKGKNTEPCHREFASTRFAFALLWSAAELQIHEGEDSDSLNRKL